MATDRSNRPEPAEAFPLREYLLEEMEAREWAKDYLGRKVEMSEQRLDTILTDDDAIVTFGEAEQLGRAFDMNPELFLRLQLAYRKWAARQKKGK